MPENLMEQIVQQALDENPQECCGLLSGIHSGESWLVQHCFPLRNVARSMFRYRADVQELLQVSREIRRSGEVELVVYHSHPGSLAVPSQTDLKENGWGTSAMHLIISLADDFPTCRGWWLLPDSYVEANWFVINNPSY
ncbi:MAG: M67 family metallopeptidase [Zavarzinella sp.]